MAVRLVPNHPNSANTTSPSARCLTVSLRVRQVGRVHRGARQCRAEKIPVEPAWVMPAKGVFDVQDRHLAVPVAGVDRERDVSSPSSMPGCFLTHTRRPLRPFRILTAGFSHAIWIVRRRRGAAVARRRGDRRRFPRFRRDQRRGRSARLSIRALSPSIISPASARSRRLSLF